MIINHEGEKKRPIPVTYPPFDDCITENNLNIKLFLSQLDRKILSQQSRRGGPGPGPKNRGGAPFKKQQTDTETKSNTSNFFLNKNNGPTHKGNHSNTHR